DEAMTEAGPLAERLVPCISMEEMVAGLKTPRQILVMVQAGAPVDETIAQLKPLIEPGDTIIDAGNANYRDTVRRAAALTGEGYRFLGIGVSGGEEGARHGPSIMAGGTRESWARAEPILTAIAARFEGEACAAYVGPGGAGHFVKTIHNGIEYADMQMIAETYGVMRHGLAMEPAAIADVFKAWRRGPLDSYLIEITADVLRAVDADTGRPTVDVIVDSAGQKGTGRWAVMEALDLGVPVSAIAAAVDARSLSAARDLRATIARRFATAPTSLAGSPLDGDPSVLEKALIAGKILAYAQGFAAMQAASADHGWDLPLATVARIWRAGCIIRSAFLDTIASAYDGDPKLSTIVLDPALSALLQECLPAMRTVLATAVSTGHPTPALSAAVSYFDSLGRERSTADLIQGQRDYFGAHGFQRVDKPGVHHGTWQGG
ncbi:MAG TPA: NADP-dependent phosphogluconate dehydrogenase, partial [Methylomirabilota bacterium]|nr:NADP-dependent phosphogluconate dehydrogenase [Methylomirabilota bacterium]